MENYPINTWYLDTLTNVNITNPIFTSDATRSKIGYYRMTTLDISSGANNVGASSVSTWLFFLLNLYYRHGKSFLNKTPLQRTTICNHPSIMLTAKRSIILEAITTMWVQLEQQIWHFKRPLCLILQLRHGANRLSLVVSSPQCEDTTQWRFVSFQGKAMMYSLCLQDLIVPSGQDVLLYGGTTNDANRRFIFAICR